MNYPVLRLWAFFFQDFTGDNSTGIHNALFTRLLQLHFFLTKITYYPNGVHQIEKLCTTKETIKCRDSPYYGGHLY